MSAELRELGLWCRKGHWMEPGDDWGQCEPSGVVYVRPAVFVMDDNDEWVEKT